MNQFIFIAFRFRTFSFLATLVLWAVLGLPYLALAETITVTAGTSTVADDGFRLSEGWRIDAQSTYRAWYLDNTSGCIYPGYLVRHHVFFTLAMPLAVIYLRPGLKSC